MAASDVDVDDAEVALDADVASLLEAFSVESFWSSCTMLRWYAELETEMDMVTFEAEPQSACSPP